MAKVDIIDVMIAVHRGELKIVVQNGFFLLENTKSGERVRLNEADVVPVVHGHWCWEGKFKACSECGSYVEWDETLGANFWKFCPYCGAKMDGDNE